MASAMRAMLKAVIQFGLVTVPCRMHLALDPLASGAHLLHGECLNRIQERTWCPHCDRPVARSETVRGFPLGDGRYVTVSDEEYAARTATTPHTIQVAQFLSVEEAARLEVYSRQPYYLAPEDLGRRAFALLCATLEATGLAGIARLTIREREHLATIRVFADGLLLTTLAWPDEIRPIQGLDLPAHADVPEAELGLARDLVLAMRRPFDPAAFRDERADSLRRLVEAKAASAAFIPPEAAPSTGVVDLMAALEASVAAIREARGGAGKRAASGTPRPRGAKRKEVRSRAA